jgi:hypothetical protein
MAEDYIDWFHRQSESVQIKILGENRWTSWREGHLSFDSAFAALNKNMPPVSPEILGGLAGM